MSKLAVRLAVSAAAASVVMTGIEALRLRHPEAAPVPQPSPEAEEEPPAPAPKVVAQPVARPAPKPVKRLLPSGPFAMARIHGRVIGEHSTDDLALTVDDGKRAYDPALEDDGRFEINLPPGTYALTASAGRKVAVAQVDDLAENEDREVTMSLALGLTIEGRVECDGPCTGVSVGADMQRTHARVSSCESVDGGQFTLEGLAPGHTYDVVFEMPGRRRLLIPGIAAPRRGLLATLEPKPTLSGGFGIEPGQECPMQSLEIEPQDEVSGDLQFDANCRFAIDDLPDLDRVHLRASGEGWHFEVDVALPAHGDPPFLCLHPPCREPEEPANLELALSGSQEVSVYLIYEGDHGGVVTSCNPRRNCVLRDLQPGKTVTVRVSSEACESQPLAVYLHSGTNFANVACTARPAFDDADESSTAVGELEDPPPVEIAAE
jgi:hypothetical protein